MAAPTPRQIINMLNSTDATCAMIVTNTYDDRLITVHCVLNGDELGPPFIRMETTDGSSIPTAIKPVVTDVFKKDDRLVAVKGTIEPLAQPFTIRLAPNGRPIAMTLDEHARKVQVLNAHINLGASMVPSYGGVDLVVRAPKHYNTPANSVLIDDCHIYTVTVR